MRTSMSMSMTMPMRTSAPRNGGKGRLATRLKKSLPVYALLLPGLTLLALFHYAPIYGIVIAFKDFSPFKGILGSDWVGFKYFIYFLGEEAFWRVLRNTLVINF